MYKSKVVTCYEELNTCKSQLMKCYEDLHKKENDLIKLVEQEELLMLRKALSTFEKININVKDPTRRAESWSAYFEDAKPKEVLEKVKFNHANLKNTVRTRFLRMNAKLHEVYPINHEMIIRETTISPDEQKLLRALWQLSPFRKGDLKIVSDKE